MAKIGAFSFPFPGGASPVSPLQPAAVTPAVPVAAGAAAPDGLSADARAAFNGLSEGDRQTFVSLWRASKAEDRDRLGRLLQAGTLAKKDSTGATALANLGALARIDVPAGAPYTAMGIVSEVVGHLDNPELLHQDSKNTCAATTVSYVLLTTQPAEYVRLTAGLAGPGSVKLQTGRTLTRVGDSLAKDDTNRDDVMRLMQAAFMDEAVQLRGSYSNVSDTFSFGGGKNFFQRVAGTFGSPLTGLFHKLGADIGLGEHAVSGLYHDVLGVNAHAVGDLPGSDFLLPAGQRRGVYDQVATAVAKGRSVPVDIVTAGLQDAPGQQSEHVIDQSKMGYSDLMKSHQVLVTKIEGDKVYYRNPWGYSTFMSLAEFKSRLTDAVIPG